MFSVCWLNNLDQQSSHRNVLTNLHCLVNTGKMSLNYLRQQPRVWLLVLFHRQIRGTDLLYFLSFWLVTVTSNNKQTWRAEANVALMKVQSSSCLWTFRAQFPQILGTSNLPASNILIHFKNLILLLISQTWWELSFWVPKFNNF